MLSTPAKLPAQTSGIELVADHDRFLARHTHALESTMDSKGKRLAGKTDGRHAQLAARARNLVLMPVIGHHVKGKAKLARMVEPGGNRFGSAFHIARHQRIVAIEHDRTLSLSPKLIEVDALDAGYITGGRKPTHDDRDSEYSLLSFSNCA